MRPDFQLPPPANWQDFESLCWRLWKSIWNDRNAQKNGRQGQPQAGVDVFGQPDRGEDWAGVQCKGKDLYTHAKLATAEVESEVKKAKGFKPSLSEYIIATSGPRSVQTQQLARQISKQHRQQGLFSVHVYGWEDIVDRLSEFSDLYSGYLRELRLADLKIGGQRLPRTTGHLYGREAELQSLTEAWEKDGHNVLSIVAWGGVGKTALVKHWLGQMAVEKFRGAERVFTWSFYSQGAKDQAASADQFVDQALRFFEDPDPAQGGPYDKGARLADFVTRYQTLLVLDGLEPLQYPSGPLEGQLKGPALQVLIDRLSLKNTGLCLITTQAKLSDIAYLEGTTASAIELEHLSSEVGAVLLDRLGVTGTTEKLQEACQAFDGHALALTLLGTYLADVHNGDVRHWKEVPLLDKEAPQGGHARRVMQSYQNRLGKTPEWSLLRLMGFFDRPAKRKEIQALLNEPPIGGLTRHLLKLDSTSRKRALARLRRLRLLGGSLPDDPDTMDAHPLVRKYLSDQLQERHPAAFLEGHRRLFEHLRKSAKQLPDTMEEMMPLYQAVAHGCRAGLHQKALDEVYKPRILRREHFSWRKLGALEADLVAVSNFFEGTWDRQSGNISNRDQALLLNQAGIYLQGQGRITEAVEPALASFKASIIQEDLHNAAISAINLSELHLALGKIRHAVSYAQKCLELTDHHRDANWGVKSSSCLANALHQSGDVSQAHSLFQNAERLQKQLQTDYPLLYSLQGFCYCDLLLGGCDSLAWRPTKHQPESTLSFRQAISRCREARERAVQTLKWAKQEEFLLDISLDHLTLGRTFLLEVALASPSSDLQRQGQHHLERAIIRLRQGNRLDYLPRALIARSQFHRVQSHIAEAQQDLDEASQFASRGPMPLFQADIHLERSRLLHAQSNLDQARQYLSMARELIRKYGYHRRDPEVKALEEMLEE